MYDLAVRRTSASLPYWLHDTSIYHAKRFIALDFETTSLEKGSPLNKDNRLLLACWEIVDASGNVLERKSHWGGIYDQQELLRDLEAVPFVVAHNAKFELGWLRNCGVNLRSVMAWDTFLAGWVERGNLNTPIHLGALAKKAGLPTKMEHVARLINLGVCPSDIPQGWLEEYCFRDVELCRKLFLHYRDLLRDRDQLHIWHVRNLTCGVLADMEPYGMHLDAERVGEEYGKQLAAKEEAQTFLRLEYGEINFASDKQLRELLYDTLKFKLPTDRYGKPILTGAGNPSVSLDNILNLKATNKKQRRFLELYEQFNEADSRLTKSLSFFKGVCDEKDERFAAVFNQGVTATHRLSSSGRKITLSLLGNKEKGVQLQNQPREYKRLFRASAPGRVLGECDGSQLEFRVAADLCQDPVAMQDIEDKKDVHQVTADFLNVSRQDAKAGTFRPLFGGKSGTDEVKAYIEYFNNRYSRIAEEQRRWTFSVLKDKFLRTRFGMMYFWPHVRMSRSGYIEYTTNIYNYPIQGGATGEIIPIALFHLWYRLDGTDIFLVNTVHDSIVADLPEEDAAYFAELCKEAMTKDVLLFLRKVYNYEFVTPLGTEVKIGTHWSESDRWKAEFDVKAVGHGVRVTRKITLPDGEKLQQEGYEEYGEYQGSGGSRSGVSAFG